MLIVYLCLWLFSLSRDVQLRGGWSRERAWWGIEGFGMVGIGRWGVMMGHVAHSISLHR